MLCLCPPQGAKGVTHMSRSLSLRAVLSAAVVFAFTLACSEGGCPSCSQLEEQRVRECERTNGPGAIVVGFRCEYASDADPCGFVTNRGQCNFNGSPAPGIRETVTPNF